MIFNIIQTSKWKKRLIISLPIWPSVLILFLVIGLSVGVLGVSATKKARCSDFHTQAEAQAVYENGATYLDANHDGIACNSLLNN